MMFSSNTSRFVLALAAACNAVTSVTAADEVILGSAENYVILTKTGISTVPDSVITGDIGVSPIAATAMTGFSLTMDSGGEHSTSSQLHGTGMAFAADYAAPIGTQLTAAVSDMEAAYTDAESRPNTDDDRTNLGAGTLGGIYGGATGKLTPGVYTFGSDVKIADDIHFEGTGAGVADDVFIIQMTGSLLQTKNTKVILSNGARAENIFWQVAGQVVVGASADMQGVLLVKTDVTFQTGSSLSGRVLAQTRCNLQVATVAAP
jgi:hypothetical protein